MSRVRLAVSVILCLVAVGATAHQEEYKEFSPRLQYQPGHVEEVMGKRYVLHSFMRHHYKPSTGGLSFLEEESLAGPTAGKGVMPAKYEQRIALGSGTFGEVWECEDLSTHERFALKIIRPQGATLSDSEQQEVHNEWYYGSQVFDHPNVMKTFAYKIDPNNRRALLVMELCGGGDVRSMPKLKIPGLIQQLVAGTGYIASMGYSHHDLKPANVAVSAKGEVKVIDLGGVVKCQASGKVGTVGTPTYAAPEWPARAWIDNFCDRFDAFAVAAITLKWITNEGPAQEDLTRMKCQSGEYGCVTQALVRFTGSTLPGLTTVVKTHSVDLMLYRPKPTEGYWVTFYRKIKQKKGWSSYATAVGSEKARLTLRLLWRNFQARAEDRPALRRLLNDPQFCPLWDCPVAAEDQPKGPGPLDAMRLEQERQQMELLKAEEAGLQAILARMENDARAIKGDEEYDENVLKAKDEMAKPFIGRRDGDKPAPALAAKMDGYAARQKAAREKVVDYRRQNEELAEQRRKEEAKRKMMKAEEELHAEEKIRRDLAAGAERVKLEKDLEAAREAKRLADRAKMKQMEEEEFRRLAEEERARADGGDAVPTPEPKLGKRDKANLRAEAVEPAKRPRAPRDKMPNAEPGEKARTRRAFNEKLEKAKATVIRVDDVLGRRDDDPKVMARLSPVGDDASLGAIEERMEWIRARRSAILKVINQRDAMIRQDMDEAVGVAELPPTPAEDDSNPGDDEGPEVPLLDLGGDDMLQSFRAYLRAKGGKSQDDGVVVRAADGTITVEGYEKVLSKGRKEEIPARSYYGIDGLFGQEVDNTALFRKVMMPLMEPVFGTRQGSQAIVFLYGQTGSGKTWTMTGDKRANEIGILQMAMAKIFEMVGGDSGVRVQMQYVEMFNPNPTDRNINEMELYDLIDPSKDRLGKVVSNLKLYNNGETDVLKKEIGSGADRKLEEPWLTIPSAEEMVRVMMRARSNVHEESTNMNGRSSRGHTVLHIRYVFQNGRRHMVGGQMTFCDLAGWEESQAARTAGQAMQGKVIRHSLEKLQQAITDMTRGKVTSFRQYGSTLVRVLSKGLASANVFTTMISTFSPERRNLPATATTVDYTARTKLINQEFKNEAPQRMLPVAPEFGDETSVPEIEAKVKPTAGTDVTVVVDGGAGVSCASDGQIEYNGDAYPTASSSYTAAVCGAPVAADVLYSRASVALSGMFNFIDYTKRVMYQATVVNLGAASSRAAQLNWQSMLIKVSETLLGVLPKMKAAPTLKVLAVQVVADSVTSQTIRDILHEGMTCDVMGKEGQIVGSNVVKNVGAVRKAYRHDPWMVVSGPESFQEHIVEASSVHDDNTVAIVFRVGVFVKETDMQPMRMINFVYIPVPSLGFFTTPKSGPQLAAAAIDDTLSVMRIVAEKKPKDRSLNTVLEKMLSPSLSTRAPKAALTLINTAGEEVAPLVRCSAKLAGAERAHDKCVVVRKK